MYSHVSIVYSIAAVLYSQSALHVMLFPMINALYLYISTSCSICAVCSMAVFCSLLISCPPGMLFRYCLSEFEIVPVAPTVIVWHHFCFYIPLLCTFIVRSLYVRIFSASLFITFCLQEFQHLLTCTFPVYHHAL